MTALKDADPQSQEAHAQTSRRRALAGAPECPGDACVVEAMIQMLAGKWVRKEKGRVTNLRRMQGALNVTGAYASARINEAPRPDVDN